MNSGIWRIGQKWYAKVLITYYGIKYGLGEQGNYYTSTCEVEIDSGCFPKINYTARVGKNGIVTNMIFDDDLNPNPIIGLFVTERYQKCSLSK